MIKLNIQSIKKIKIPKKSTKKKPTYNRHGSGRRNDGEHV